MSKYYHDHNSFISILPPQYLTKDDVRDVVGKPDKEEPELLIYDDNYRGKRQTKCIMDKNWS